jgi:hypothetical protein
VLPAAGKSRLTDPSPAWQALATSPLRALPNLLVIGAQKAGTTSLHALLAGHPEIAMSRVKECNELVRARPSKWRYRAFFPYRGPAGRRGVRWFGESTPYYLFHPEAPVQAARMLGGARGRLRAIAILRDPVERAWSHYRHAVRHGFETEPFGRALALEEARLGERSGGRADAHRHQSYFARGCYAPQLARWYAAIGREHVLVLSFEELLAPSPGGREAIGGFLGLHSPIEGTLPERNRGERDAEGPPAEAREALRHRFAPHVAEVEALLGRRFGWLGT